MSEFTYYTFNGTAINPEDCTVDICPMDYAITEYRPSIPGNVVLMVAFGLCLLAQIPLGIRYRTWGFMVCMIGGLVLEIIGSAGRIMMNNDPFSMNPFLM